jgi:phosphoglucosamine mutase
MTKKIFGETDGIRAKVGEFPLRPNVLKTIGTAIAGEMQANEFVMARDTRLSGLWMKDSLTAGLEAGGITVKDLGVLPTPAISKILEQGSFDGGIMITASHNPATDNGVKLFVANGDKSDDDLELAIEARYFASDLEPDIELPELEYIEMGTDSESVEKYVEMARGALLEGKNNETPVSEMFVNGKIMLDAASGSGHNFSRLVFEDFGLEVEVIDPEPNGENINDGYGALHPEKLSEYCKKNGVMGIALDGDADRAILVDEYGRIWSGDRIVAFLANYLKADGKLQNDTVVLTEYSNLAAVNYLKAQGVKVEKVVNGDRAVAQKCKELGAILGGENAGHIIYLPWLNSSDGTFVALLAQYIIREKGCALADLWPDYEEFPNEQLGIKVREKRPLEEVPGWTEALAAAQERLSGRGRVFTRYSGTEMKLRILVEGPDFREDHEVAEKLKDIIEKEIGA